MCSDVYNLGILCKNRCEAKKVFTDKVGGKL